MTMDITLEIIKNILATSISAITLAVMFARYLNKERLHHAKIVSDIIDKTANKIFDTAGLEHRVKLLEKAEKENQEYMRESFAQVHARLDQIYSIIASK